MDVTKLISLIQATAEAFVPGVAEFEKAGQAVLDLVGSVGPTLSANDQTALQAALPELLYAMNRDVDQALKDLRG